MPLSGMRWEFITAAAVMDDMRHLHSVLMLPVGTYELKSYNWLILR
jgi:hypothetical protein